MPKKISLIIAVYNGLFYLEDCLKSVFSEITPFDEVILVDNASTDGSPFYIQQCWPQVRLIQNEKNRGFAAACNQGAALSTGEYFIFLNQDTRVLPGWAKGLIKTLDDYANIALATSKLLLMQQPDRINACGQDIHFTGMSFARGFLKSSDQYQTGAPISAVMGASFAIRRDVWEKLGGFDEELWMYYEETDLSWRAQIAGYQCLYTPDSVVYHDQSFKPSPMALFYSQRNRIILLLKTWRWRTILLLFPGILLAEAVDWCYVFLLGKDGMRTKKNAYSWLLSNRKKMMIARRKNQALRKAPDWGLLERCTYRLSPKLKTGGPAGKLITFIINGLFFLNYQLALGISRALNL